MANYTYCGFTLAEVVANPKWHESALTAAKAAVRTAEIMGQIGQCSQDALDRARDGLDSLECALTAVAARG